MSSKENIVLGTRHILKAKNVYSFGGLSLFPSQCDSMSGSPSCLALQGGTGKCPPQGNPKFSVNCPKRFESYKEQVITPALKRY